MSNPAARRHLASAQTERQPHSKQPTVQVLSLLLDAVVDQQTLSGLLSGLESLQELQLFNLQLDLSSIDLESTAASLHTSASQTTPIATTTASSASMSSRGDSLQALDSPTMSTSSSAPSTAPGATAQPQSLPTTTSTAPTTMTASSATAPSSANAASLLAASSTLDTATTLIRAPILVSNSISNGGSPATFRMTSPPTTTPTSLSSSVNSTTTTSTTTASTTAARPPVVATSRRPQPATLFLRPHPPSQTATTITSTSSSAGNSQAVPTTTVRLGAARGPVAQATGITTNVDQQQTTPVTTILVSGAPPVASTLATPLTASTGATNSGTTSSNQANSLTTAATASLNGRQLPASSLISVGSSQSSSVSYANIAAPRSQMLATLPPPATTTTTATQRQNVAGTRLYHSPSAWHQATATAPSTTTTSTNRNVPPAQFYFMNDNSAAVTPLAHNAFGIRTQQSTSGGGGTLPAMLSAFNNGLRAMASAQRSTPSSFAGAPEPTQATTGFLATGSRLPAATTRTRVSQSVSVHGLNTQLPLSQPPNPTTTSARFKRAIREELVLSFGKLFPNLRTLHLDGFIDGTAALPSLASQSRRAQRVRRQFDANDAPRPDAGHMTDVELEAVRAAAEIDQPEFGETLARAASNEPQPDWSLPPQSQSQQPPPHMMPPATTVSNSRPANEEQAAAVESARSLTMYKSMAPVLVRLLSGLRKLRILYMEHNKLGVWPDDILIDSRLTLKRLYLMANSLHVLENRSFAQLDQLESLDVSRNNLRSLNANLFKDLQSLKSFRARYNLLRSLPSRLFSMKPTTTGVSDNQQQQATRTRLESVDLALNNLTTLASDVFSSAYGAHVMHPIANLSLAHCNLSDQFAGADERSSSELFASLPELSVLRLNGNKFRSLLARQSLFARNKRLAIVDVAHNALSSINEHLFGAQNSALRELLLGHNSLESIPEKTFLNLGSLGKLNLAHNKLRAIPADLLAACRRLEELDLSSNSIETLNTQASQVPFGISELLHTVKLNNNQLSDFEREISSISWVRYTHLTEFDLSHNLFAGTVSVPIFYVVKELTFSLNSNKIKTLSVAELMQHDSQAAAIASYDESSASKMDPSIYAQLGHQRPSSQLRAPIVTVNFANNPLSCDCLFEPLKRYAREIEAARNPSLSPTQFASSHYSIPDAREPQVLYQFEFKDAYCAEPASFKLERRTLKQVPEKDLLCPVRDARLCPAQCSCYYQSAFKALIVNCSHRQLKEVPQQLTDARKFVDFTFNEQSVASSAGRSPLSAYGLHAPTSAKNSRLAKLIVHLNNNELHSIEPLSGFFSLEPIGNASSSIEASSGTHSASDSSRARRETDSLLLATEALPLECYLYLAYNRITSLPSSFLAQLDRTRPTAIASGAPPVQTALPTHMEEPPNPVTLSPSDVDVGGDATVSAGALSMPPSASTGGGVFGNPASVEHRKAAYWQSNANSNDLSTSSSSLQRSPAQLTLSPALIVLSLHHNFIEGFDARNLERLGKLMSATHLKLYLGHNPFNCSNNFAQHEPSSSSLRHPQILTVRRLPEMLPIGTGDSLVEARDATSGAYLERAADEPVALDAGLAANTAGDGPSPADDLSASSSELSEEQAEQLHAAYRQELAPADCPVGQLKTWLSRHHSSIPDLDDIYCVHMTSELAAKLRESLVLRSGGLAGLDNATTMAPSGARSARAPSWEHTHSWTSPFSLDGYDNAPSRASSGADSFASNDSLVYPWTRASNKPLLTVSRLNIVQMSDLCPHIGGAAAALASALLSPSSQRLLVGIAMTFVLLSACLLLLLVYFGDTQTMLAFVYIHLNPVYKCLLLSESQLESEKLYDAFISYSSADRDIVMQLVERLEQEPATSSSLEFGKRLVDSSPRLVLDNSNDRIVTEANVVRSNARPASGSSQASNKTHNHQSFQDLSTMSRSTSRATMDGSSVTLDGGLQQSQHQAATPAAYRLCIHERDWLPGHLISWNIVNSVQNSRRTILVLSKEFIKSVWFQVEFQTAYYQMLEDKIDRLIVIVRGELPPKQELDKDLAFLLTTKTYLTWGEKWFWERLHYALPHRNHSLPRLDKLNSKPTSDHNHKHHHKAPQPSPTKQATNGTASSHFSKSVFDEPQKGDKQHPSLIMANIGKDCSNLLLPVQSAGRRSPSGNSESTSSAASSSNNLLNNSSGATKGGATKVTIGSSLMADSGRVTATSNSSLLLTTTTTTPAAATNNSNRGVTSVLLDGASNNGAINEPKSRFAAKRQRDMQNFVDKTISSHFDLSEL